MAEQNHSPSYSEKFWIVLLVSFLTVAGLLLVYEHRVHIPINFFMNVNGHR